MWHPREKITDRLTAKVKKRAVADSVRCDRSGARANGKAGFLGRPEAVRGPLDFCPGFPTRCARLLHLSMAFRDAALALGLTCMAGITPAGEGVHIRERLSNQLPLIALSCLSELRHYSTLAAAAAENGLSTFLALHSLHKPVSLETWGCQQWLRKKKVWAS
jgi:hypothetical protein